MKRILFALLLTSSVSVFGQSTVMDSSLLTVDGIVKESLAFISGTSEHASDWEFFRNMFDSNARFALLKNSPDGKAQYFSFPLEDFVRRGKDVYTNGNMTEVELNKTVNEYNGIAQVFQGYEVTIKDKKEQGINSYELYFDGKRWWITSLVWTSNSNGVELPAAYK